MTTQASPRKVCQYIKVVDESHVLLLAGAKHVVEVSWIRLAVELVYRDGALQRFVED